MMYLIDSLYTDPALNLALEEVLFRSYKEGFMLFYVNRPSVIVGKHQNVFKEVNLAYTEECGIPVVRRLTGGGAVYHDEGNLNFCFILNGEKGKMVDFAGYMTPVAAYIRSLGINVEMDKRYNLRINGLKISGNAEHVFRQRVLHHGTLLFFSKLDMLLQTLQPPAGIFRDKAVESLRSRVTNISENITEGMEMDNFRKGLIRYCVKYFGNEKIKTGFRIPFDVVERLADEKYRTTEWNYGYSPDFVFEHEGYLDGKRCRIIVKVQKGKMKEISLKGEVAEDFSYLCSVMEDVYYRRADAGKTLYGKTKTKIPFRMREELLALLFPEK